MKSMEFEINDLYTKKELKRCISSILDEAQGLYDYEVICDDTNNGAEMSVKGELIADVNLKFRYTLVNKTNKGYKHE